MKIKSKEKIAEYIENKTMKPQYSLYKIKAELLEPVRYTLKNFCFEGQISMTGICRTFHKRRK